MKNLRLLNIRDFFSVLNMLVTFVLEDRKKFIYGHLVMYIWQT